MPNLLRTSQASEDLLEIWLHLAETDVARADRLLDAIYEKCLLLAGFPAMGRVRHKLSVGLRSFAVDNYVVFYQPVMDGIELLRVLHGSRDIESVFDDMLGE